MIIAITKSSSDYGRDISGADGKVFLPGPAWKQGTNRMDCRKGLKNGGIRAGRKRFTIGRDLWPKAKALPGT